jgi:quinol monooxygenase YgiN
MTQVMIRHKVENYADWKSAFDGFAETRKSGGEKSYRILHPSDNPNDLVLFFEWESVEKAETFLASSELKEAMQRAGVAGEPHVQFLNLLDQGTL